jgi:hypothetical protein
MPDDFASFVTSTLGGPVAPAAGAAPGAVGGLPSPANDIGGGFPAFMKSMHLATAQAAKGAVGAAADVNPDEAGKAVQLAPQLGLPASVVETDVPGFTQQAAAAKSNALIDGNPVLASWLAANPDAARIAKDDFDKLDVVTKAATALKSGWTGAFAGDQRGRLGMQTMLGDNSPATAASIAGFDKQLAASPQLSGVYGALQKVTGFAGGLLDNFLHSAPEAYVGAAVGGAGGLAGGGPAAPVTGAVGAIGGAAVGLGVGFKWDMSQIAAGNTYLDLGNVKGAGGESIGESAKQAAAVLVGIGTYALAGLGGKASGVPQAASGLLSDAIKESVVQPTVARALGQFAGKLAAGGAEFAAINAGMEGTSIFGTELAKQLSAGDFDTVFNDPVTRQQVIDNLMSAALDGAMLGPLVRVPGAAMGFAESSIRARQAASDVEAFHALETGTADSRMRGRSLDAFHAFLARQTDGAPTENLFLPADRVRELYQSAGIEPGADDGLLGKVAPDIAEQLDQAQHTGGDVVLPTAAYVTHLAGTPLSDHLRPDIRVRPDAMSAREAMDFQSKRAEWLADQVASTHAEMEHEQAAAGPERDVFDDVFSQLRGAGHTVDAARQYAAVVAARYGARAARLGPDAGSALDLYHQAGLTVQRAVPDDLAALPVTDTDMVLNALRQGGKRLPSTRDLMGPNLTEFVKDRGGVYDDTGDLRAMDLQRERGLIRIQKKTGLQWESKAGRTINDHHVAAWEQGYFPEHGNDPTFDDHDFVNALAAESRGDRRYALGNVDERRKGFSDAAASMDRWLDDNNIDLDHVTNDDVKRMLAQHAGDAADAYDQSAYHGSPHVFDKFDSAKIGTGEGAQVFGHGLYFAGNKGIARYYRDALSKGKTVGGVPSTELSKGAQTALRMARDMGGVARGLREYETLIAAEKRAVEEHERIVADLKAHPEKQDRDAEGWGDLGGHLSGVEADLAYRKERLAHYEETLAGFKELEGKEIKGDGRLFHVDLPEDHEYLDWDKPLKDQPAHVRAALHALGVSGDFQWSDKQPIGGGDHAWMMTDTGGGPWATQRAIIRTFGDKFEVELMHEVRPDDNESRGRTFDSLDEAKAYTETAVDKAGWGSRGSDAYHDLARKLVAPVDPEARNEGNPPGWGHVEPEHREDPAAASRALLEHGVVGVRYLDAGSRGSEGGTHNYVVFDDKRVTVKSFEQRKGDEPRGKITLEDGRAIITLFAKADLSTFLHETGHLWLDEMVQDAARPDAPQGIRDDMAAILKWMKIESPDQIDTEQHELFARGFEAYLMTGKAPSAALVGAFRKFKAWMVSIYQNALGLRAPINDQMRAVMDRMLATDNEIDAARASERHGALFRDAASAGMTNAEFAAYTGAVSAARDQASDRLLRRAMEAIRAQRTKSYREERAGIRDDVERQMRTQQDQRAQYWLRTGRMLDDPEAESGVPHQRLSGHAIKGMYDNDGVFDLLPKGTYSMVHAGIQPADVAEMFGYRDGQGLVSALMNLEARRKKAVADTGKPLDGMGFLAHQVDQETDRRMMERRGDALADGSIEEEALAAVHNAAQADVMATELRALARKAGENPPFSMASLKQWAASTIADLPVDRGAYPGTYRRSEARAGREAERALLKGDLPAAWQAKQRQLVNHLLATEADLAKDDYDAGKKLFQRFAGRGAFAGIDQAYTDRIHELLKRFGFQTSRSDDELGRGLGAQTLEGFVQTKSADGYEITIDPAFFDPRLAKPLDDLTTEEFRALKDAVTSLAHVGRMEKSVVVEGQKLELSELVAEGVDQLKDWKRSDVPAEINAGTATGFRGLLEKVSSLMRTADAGMLKQEQVFDWLDNRKADGVFNRVVFEPLKAAQHRENDLMVMLTGRLKALHETMPDGWEKGLGVSKVMPELIDERTGKPFKFRHQDILALALNTGNAVNADKLARGYGWDRGDIKTVLDREMTEHDWNFVQGIWDTFETLWPDIESLTRRMTGLGPEKVEAVPVQTPHGEFRGGYYPLVYDPVKSWDAELRRQKAAGGLFENSYFKASTPKGHTLKRIDNYYAPIRLSLDAMPWKLGQAVHDLAFREAIMAADKFLGDKRLRGVVSSALGREYVGQFRPWLQSIANDRNVDDKGLTGLDWLARQARINTTMVGVGFRVTTMLKHGTTALFNSFGELGATWMLRGTREVYGSPERFMAAHDFILSQSGEMRHRINSIDRDVREGLRTIQGESGLRATAERFGHYGVAILDMGSALPTWMGAYRKALAEGVAPDAAVLAADKSVRNAHGAQGITDVAAVQRGGDVAKMFTMFYGFFNHIYNRQRDTLRTAGQAIDQAKQGEFAGARRDFGIVLARTFYYLIVPALVEAMVSEGGPDKDKDESWLGWAAKAVAGEIPAGIPLLRDAAKAAISGRTYEMSPIAKAVETAILAGRDIGSAIGLRDHEASPRWVRHAIETPGYVFGLPTGQAAGTAQYLWDIWHGDEEPDGAADFMRGLMYGPKPKGAS